MSTGQQLLDAFYAKGRKGIEAEHSYDKFCESMYRDYGNFVLNELCRGDEDMMVSIMNDSLLSIYKFSDAVLKIDSFFPTILRRKAMDWYRSRAHRNRLLESEITDYQELVIKENIIKSIEESDENQIMNLFSTLLTARQLEVFSLYYRGYNRKEISEELDIKLNTIKSTISDARKRIKDYLKGNDELRKNLYA